jgi:2-polyprenyl-3-methyl-5-hydroxy-6-metoxy-1,4-benzoquinol methylase
MECRGTRGLFPSYIEALSANGRITGVKSDLEGSSVSAGTTRVDAALARECPLCGRLERRHLAQRDAWQIVECASCNMVFIGNELSYEVQIKEHDWLDDYSKEMSRRKERHPLLLFLSRYTRSLRPETNSRLLRQTLRWRSGGKLVDFGCGDASFIEHASRKFDVTGIEISPRLAALSRQRMLSGNILEGPVTHLAGKSLPANAFDVVTQFGYIEHEWHPLAGLRAAYRVLKPGGVTVIKTPNYASWNRVVMGTDWCGYHIPAHCNYFIPETLAKMLRRAGLEPLPRPLLDSLPTSDSLWMAAQKPS